MKEFDDFETQIQCEETFLDDEENYRREINHPCDEEQKLINPHFGMTREQLQQAADAENKHFLGETPLGEKYDLMEEYSFD